MPPFPRALPLLLTLLAAACTCGPTGKPCRSTAECNAGQVCIQGQCRGGSTTTMDSGVAGGGGVADFA